MPGTGHRFGAGVSFTSMASCASHYCDKGSSGCMLLANVLVSNVVEVPEHADGGSRACSRVLREPPFLPGRYPLRYDTTAKNKDAMDVIGKFDKDAFLPTHVVNFRRGALGASAVCYYNYDDEDDDFDDDKSFSDTDSDYQVDDNFDDYSGYYGGDGGGDDDD